MILSKASLSIVELTTPDKDVPVLDCICIEPTGVTVACNRNIMVAVLPLTSETIKNVPLDDTGRLQAQMVLTSETTRAILKTIPKDRLFKGALEFCDIDNKGMVTTTDGRQRHTMQIAPVRVRFPGYRTEFRTAICGQEDWITTKNEKQMGGTKFITNRKRFRAFVETLEKVCPYDGDFSPMQFDFSSSDYVVARSRNELTNQAVIGIIARGKGNSIEIDKGESILYRMQAKKIT
jgi:hypothetical protein